ncbi:MAG: LytTR family DNA-binding domain-containing protein [Gammaproteobacteria bacterium]|nr:LytTR family DNA-binding domain-containing protein [Gammaproteobacteria bacterium]MDH3767323.1 LytTR family DNA-binding domain-containing protein [Gammaproteobacteria bacterium]
MKVLIVDDEMPARQRLHRLVDELDDCEIVGEAANGNQAIELAQKHVPDVLLMDIRMPGISGIETARHLATLDRPPAVIFTTAYDEYAIAAFDTQAVGYLLKPVRRERLARALRHASRLTRSQLSALATDDTKAEARRTHLCARVRGHLELIPIETIYYFQADQKYTTVAHMEGEVLIDESLKNLEYEFSPDFVRIHRSALVSVAHLRAVERDADGKQFAVFRDCDARLVVSRRHAPALKRRLRGS